MMFMGIKRCVGRANEQADQGQDDNAHRQQQDDPPDAPVWVYPLLSLHFEQARAALSAGKHVICEYIRS